jgi:hypothetical protein
MKQNLAESRGEISNLIIMVEDFNVHPPMTEQLDKKPTGICKT